MALPEFLRALFDHGHLKVPQPTRLESTEELAAASAILGDFESSWRLEFPGQPPAFDPQSALWGATMLYRAAQAAVYRDVSDAQLRGGLTVECPPSDEPSRHYSVDVVFRFLPDVVNLARRASQNDPLLEILQAWANRWPLSSVGMKDVLPVSLEAITAQAGLLQVYVDRIVARKDWSRLAEPQIRRAARQALGAYAELSPELAKELEKE
jgi:hypothetical protein